MYIVTVLSLLEVFAFQRTKCRRLPHCFLLMLFILWQSNFRFDEFRRYVFAQYIIPISITLHKISKIYTFIHSKYSGNVILIFCILVHRKPIIHLKISEKCILTTPELICIKRKQCGNRRYLVSYTSWMYGELSTATMDT